MTHPFFGFWSGEILNYTKNRGVIVFICHKNLKPLIYKCFIV